ncbi:carbamoyl-phosphate synthase L chain, ATP binding domain-containing protein [Mucor lusitanicus]|uniref:Carbamoyl-phosphate synthase L chain, ATP binding domain-containing protein n=2 Tax=Mucor circinelloides f. lusitanicus TaxID=29924 RepID=A0A8H4F3H7_MUCCL|nr:carbamoyl-phosphate synthase L chain, ATP binding domain-containing protein [Mucor lusitanicus]
MTKILVANRGEIAIRIITAATELGLETVAVYSDNQDRSHCIGAHESIKLKNTLSFLDPQQIVDAAKSVHATAIHPGYGFLSESTDLADKCKQSGILFIGPSASCIAAVGDKVSARQVAKAAGVPVIPGTEESISTPEQVYAFADQFGYPVMLKARDGGGGRGIRMVHAAKEVPDALKRCINESPSKQVFIEKAVIGAKHIEVQILGDNHGNVIHLFERDCSIQRRYQKILEVAPCPCLSPQLRDNIHQAATQLAKHIHYNSAGTVEFLVRPDVNEFYFLEVNPRVQVEHTISEQITHVDIVQTQIRVALGENLQKLGLVQDAIQPNRLVSIQARVVAENPLNNNMLSVGKINAVQFPQGHGIRVDTWIQPGCVVLPTFDSLLAKVIVTGQSYDDALHKLKRALQNTVIEGVETNIQFLIAVISDRGFIGDQLAHVHIKSLEDKMNDLITATKQLGESQRKTLESSNSTTNPTSNAVAGASANAISSLHFKPGDAFNIEISNSQTKAVESVHSLQIDSISTNNFPDEFVAQFQTSFPSVQNPVSIALTRKSAIGTSSTLRRKASPRVPTDIGSPVTGMVVEINVKEGDVVTPGQQLFVMSAMKMETVIQAPAAGTVKAIYAAPNDLVDGGDMVVELTKDSKL